LIPNHSIENDKQFTHTGGNDHFVSFALLLKPVSKCANHGIEATGCKRGHIQHTSDIFSAAPNMRFAVRFSGRPVPWSQAGQGGDFLPVELAKLRQICNEHCRGLRPYTRCALEDTVFAFEIVISVDILSDEPVDFIDLKIQSFHHFLNTFFNLRVMNHKQTVGFLCSKVIELASSSDKFGQLNGLRLRVRFRRRFDNLCEFRQHLRIDRVGLCPLAYSFGKVANLSRIDHYNRQRSIEQFGCERPFITTGRFEDDERNCLVLELSADLVMAMGCVRQAGFDEVGAGGDVKGVFGDVDTDINRFRHGFVPYLQMRARGFPAAQTAVRACPTGATRIPLCDGLEDPDTIDLSSLAGFGSVRYAHLAKPSFTYEIIPNHGRCQHTRPQRLI
jgi:hypothetical protein